MTPGQPASPGVVHRLASRLRRRFSPPAERSPALVLDGGPPPFFIVGCGKSGTSWLMNMLDSHPAILCHGEGRFFGLRHQVGAPGMRSLERTLFESPELREWAAQSAWTRRSDPAGLARSWAAVLARATMAGALEASGKQIVGDKTPLNGPGVVAAIRQHLPDSRVIHIIRDGRDVAVSSVHHRWNVLGVDAEAAARNPDDVEIRDAYRQGSDEFIAAGRSIFCPGSLRSYAEAWVEQVTAARREGRESGADRYIEVRYEDLLEASVDEYLRLCGFLGMETSREQAKDCVAHNSFERLAEGRSAGVEDSAAFLRSGTAGDWRRVFTNRDADEFQRLAGRTLTALGYEAGGA